MTSLSTCPMAHPPRSNPPLRSSSDPPGACITPSTETCIVVVSFMLPFCAQSSCVSRTVGSSSFVQSPCTATDHQKLSPAARQLPYVVPYTDVMRKTSVYLDEDQAERLARLAREEGRSQAE